MTQADIISGAALYLTMGSLSEIMIGYAAPTNQQRSSWWVDFSSFLLWPIMWASTCGNFGGAPRHGRLR